MKTIHDLVRNAPSGWERSQPAEPDDIGRLERRAPLPLPADYLDFLRASNGGEGPLGVEPGWFAIWPVEHVWERNLELSVFTELPGYFAFGSNGAGEMFVLHLAAGEPFPVSMVPSIGDGLVDLVRVAPSFRALVEQFGVEMPESEVTDSAVES